jgi:hypothetical protein
MKGNDMTVANIMQSYERFDIGHPLHTLSQCLCCISCRQVFWRLPTNEHTGSIGDNLGGIH